MIVAVPWFFPVASPLFDVTVATFVAEDVQVDRFEMFCVVPSEKFPLAVNCCCVPTSMVGLAGVTVIEFSEAFVTVRVADPEMLPMVALMVALPGPTAVAMPFVPPVLLTVATVLEDEFQVTPEVRFCVL